MLKSERDQLMTSLTREERQDFRRVIEQIKEARRARGVSAREVVESQPGNYSPKVRGALEGVVARDEMGPGVGQEPPDFFLKRMGSDDKVRLSSFKGKRPVALVFGSYT
jgi:hypothetical protein